MSQNNQFRGGNQPWQASTDAIDHGIDFSIYDTPRETAYAHEEFRRKISNLNGTPMTDNERQFWVSDYVNRLKSSQEIDINIKREARERRARYEALPWSIRLGSFIHSKFSKRRGDSSRYVPPQPLIPQQKSKG